MVQLLQNMFIADGEISPSELERVFNQLSGLASGRPKVV